MRALWEQRGGKPVARTTKLSPPNTAGERQTEMIDPVVEWHTGDSHAELRGVSEIRQGLAAPRRSATA
jgi:hypothetical protein